MNSSGNLYISSIGQAVQLFSMTKNQINEAINKNAETAIIEDLKRIKETTDILTNKNTNLQETRIYPKYIGCIIKDSDMNEIVFTAEDLKNAGFTPTENESYRDLINTIFKTCLEYKLKHSETDEARTRYLNSISSIKDRVYGFWINPNNEAGFALKLDVTDCNNAKKYKNIMLIIDGMNQDSFFNTIDKIDSIFTIILVKWKNYDQLIFNKKIQEQIYVILKEVLKFFDENKDIFKSMKWNQFGEKPNIIDFKNFEDVINAVLYRIPLIVNDKEQFITKYVNPLLK